jgi:16S rRNA (cytidine1402-2'-O)-methyltransferase
MKTLGTCYIVATPIGNLDDMTYRAVNILKKVDLIAAEDTRYSKILMQHYGIKTKLISAHEFNEAKRVAFFLERLKNGESIALISDAGTPLISDPGVLLVKEMREAGADVVPVPGACALIAALCAAGLPTDKFIFEGFLSAKSAKRLERLKILCEDERTIIFYEAPHRILKLMREIDVVFEETRQIVLAKELTKTFETFFSGTAKEICFWLQEDDRRQKGEFVVLVGGACKDNKEEILSKETLRVLDILLSELSVKKASELAAKITGDKKNLIYQAALEN